MKIGNGNNANAANRAAPFPDSNRNSDCVTESRPTSANAINGAASGFFSMETPRTREMSRSATYAPTNAATNGSEGICTSARFGRKNRNENGSIAKTR